MRKSKRSPDPPKHVRDRLRRPLAAPRRPNAATIERGGDLPKRLRPGGLGLANGRRNAVGEGVGRRYGSRWRLCGSPYGRNGGIADIQMSPPCMIFTPPALLPCACLR